MADVAAVAAVIWGAEAVAVAAEAVFTLAAVVVVTSRVVAADAAVSFLEAAEVAVRPAGYGHQLLAGFIAAGPALQIGMKLLLLPPRSNPRRQRKVIGICPAHGPRIAFSDA